MFLCLTTRVDFVEHRPNSAYLWSTLCWLSKDRFLTQLMLQ